MDHPLSTWKLMERMEEEYQIRLHRTTVSKYIELLNESGIEVMKLRSREKKYYLGDRLFELPELKLLVGAVQSSKVIPKRKSRDLISRPVSLTSEANAEKLKRNLYVVGRVKPDNEKCYYIVDSINRSKWVSFLYTDYNMEKERVLRSNGESEEVSLLCENSLMKHLIDHFSLDVETEITDESHFRAKARVCASPTFYLRVFGWGQDAD